MNKRIGQIALLSFLGFVIGTASAWYEVNKQQSAGYAVAGVEPAAGQANGDIGGAFSLTDHNGNAVTEKNYEESYKLVYFGFTMCPDICPTGLQKISKTLDILGAKAEQVQPLFITVDPARDTPEVMKNYVAQFSPRLIGLTGSEEQVKQVIDSYKVYAAKSQDPSLSDYTIDHSAFTFFMAPDGRMVSLFSSDDTADAMAAEIGKTLPNTQ